jgi:RNA-directed DNA polymerase
MAKTKPFAIPKQKVWEAYKLVKANQGAAGVDEVSIAEFEIKLKDNLYKIWNRMSSGGYFPPPVRRVAIPKKQGGERTLGIPTVGDRIAQMVAKLHLEPELEPYFHKDSYGYRPGKSALDAIAVTRKRCWQYDWVLEFDIKGAFDNIDHELLLKALRKHSSCPWLLLYTERWLKAPFEQEDGELVEREKGTPQGGVVSPLLANLFLHYVFDKWMVRNNAHLPFCRYADDGLVHCRTREEAHELKEQLELRFRECKLELHPDKTKIIYCKDDKRPGKYEHIKFDFLGYTFRPRRARSPLGYFVGFTPAVSNKATKSVRDKVRKAHLHRQVDKTIEQIAEIWNPALRGWINYYGRFYKSALYPTLNHFNQVLERWVKRKYRQYKHNPRAAKKWLGRI